MPTIYVISHREINWALPEGLIPIYVGKDADRYVGLNDRSGDSIWTRNETFSELTAQYWIWKNHLANLVGQDRVGFCHYRRYFTPNSRVRSVDVLAKTSYSADSICSRIRGNGSLLARGVYFRREQRGRVLPKPLECRIAPHRYYSLREQYGVHHNVSDLDVAISILPDCIRDDFTQHLETYELSPYNMYCTSVGNFGKFFGVLFPWLFEVEDALSVMGRGTYQSRVFGFLAERFASCYFRKHFSPQYLRVSQVV